MVHPVVPGFRGGGEVVPAGEVEEQGTGVAQELSEASGVSVVGGQVIARAVARGELPDVPRSTRLVNLPFDLFRHDIFMTMRAVSTESIIEIVDEVWLPLLGVPGTRPDGLS